MSDVEEVKRERNYKAYEAIWRNMERENALVNFRNQWTIVLSGGIGVTEGVLVSGITEVESKFYQGLIVLLMLFLSCVAIVFCLKAREGVIAAHNQLKYLLDQYNEFKDENGKNIFENELKLPRPFGNPEDHNRGSVAAKTFPSVLLSIWVLFAAIQGVVSTILIKDAVANWSAHLTGPLEVTKGNGPGNKTSSKPVRNRG